MTENGVLVRVRDLKMHFPITQGIIIQRKADVMARHHADICVYHTDLGAPAYRRAGVDLDRDEGFTTEIGRIARSTLRAAAA